MSETASECGFDRVGIVGLGLMGGSLARALKSLNAPPHVAGFSLDPEDGELAQASGVVDEVTSSVEDLVAQRDLVVYATPLGATLELIRSHAADWGDAAVTDVVSLKVPLVNLMAELSESRRYAGSHPMAGGEGSGFQASSVTLFSEARIWLVRGEGATRAADGVEQMWRSLGSTPLWTEAAEHDTRMAWVSHLPQLVANALASALATAGYAPADLGPGGADMIRLAASSPDMWVDLFGVSAPLVGKALSDLGVDLGRLGEALAEGDMAPIAELMALTRTWKGTE